MRFDSLSRCLPTGLPNRATTTSCANPILHWTPALQKNKWPLKAVAELTRIHSAARALVPPFELQWFSPLLRVNPHLQISLCISIAYSKLLLARRLPFSNQFRVWRGFPARRAPENWNMPVRRLFSLLLIALVSGRCVASAHGPDSRIYGEPSFTLAAREHQIWPPPLRDSKFAAMVHATASTNCEASEPPEPLATPNPLIDIAEPSGKVSVSFIIGTDRSGSFSSHP